MTALPSRNRHDTTSAWQAVAAAIVEHSLPAPAAYRVEAGGIQTRAYLSFSRCEDLRLWADRLGVDPPLLRAERGGWQYRAHAVLEGRLHVWMHARVGLPLSQRAFAWLKDWRAKDKESA